MKKQTKRKAYYLVLSLNQIEDIIKTIKENCKNNKKQIKNKHATIVLRFYEDKHYKGQLVDKSTQDLLEDLK